MPRDILKVIPANMIKRIEVITEPGAKYDAEGVSAILNIVDERQHFGQRCDWYSQD
jgi:outer membrane receptor for ferrienterochelin and colicin